MNNALIGNLNTLHQLSDAESRSISPENPTGKKSKGGMATSGTGERAAQDLRVTIQALGWRSDKRYLPLQDDIASVAYWYQTLPTAQFSELPAKDYLEVI